MSETSPESSQVPGWVPTDQVQAMIDAAVAHAMQNPVNGGLTAEQVQQQISDALAAQKVSHDAELAALYESLRTSGQISYIPTHGAGPGSDVADTWSQYEQQRAYAADEARRAA